VVLATGLPFETVAGFTQGQFAAIRKAIGRHWELTASVNGIQAMFGDSDRQPEPTDATAELEARVRRIKKLTGRETLDLWEVL